ncbi:hypothetical protein ACOMHN_012323 [Nucella lapillus]
MARHVTSSHPVIGIELELSWEDAQGGGRKPHSLTSHCLAGDGFRGWGTKAGCMEMLDAFLACQTCWKRLSGCPPGGHNRWCA